MRADGCNPHGLLDLLLERLELSQLSDHAQLLVLAAYQGQEDLDQALEGAGDSRPAEEAGSAEPNAIHDRT